MSLKAFRPKRSGKAGPERIIQDAIMDMLRIQGFFVMETHGNMYQSGFPDLFTCHSRYGQRWVEIKLPGGKGSKFTPAQIDCFPKICANGSGVWILTAATEEEYQKLFKPCNWYQYLGIWKRGM